MSIFSEMSPARKQVTTYSRTNESYFGFHFSLKLLLLFTNGAERLLNEAKQQKKIKFRPIRALKTRTANAVRPCGR